jgi:hypothetical protein
MTLALPKEATGEVWAPKPLAVGAASLDGAKVWEAGKMIRKGGAISDCESRVAVPAMGDGGLSNVVLVLRGGKTFYIASRSKT